MSKPLVKGVTSCNRTACQVPLIPGQIWENKVMRANYCPTCARLINAAGDNIAEPLCMIEASGLEEQIVDLFQEIKDMHPEGGLNSPRDIQLVHDINAKAALMDKLQDKLRLTQPGFEISKEQISLEMVDGLLKPWGRPYSKEILESMFEPTSINNFEEYGFTADFEGIIYEVTDETIYGRAGIQPISWTPVGYAWLTSNQRLPAYDLTPIVPEVVYPVFKKGVWGMVNKYHNATDFTVVLGPTESMIQVGCEGSELNDSSDLVPYDSERGLYHGQPIYIYLLRGRKTSRMIKHFDIEAEYSQGVEPIPLDTLKTMPFIWEQYKEFIK